MEDPIEFARKCKHKEVRRARDYSKENGHKNLEYEASVIDGMIRPESWEAVKFARAILGNYVLLWEKNGVLLPADWTGKKVDELNQFREALQEYLHMPQGWLWLKKYSPHWVAGMVRAGRATKRLEISLRAYEVEELERMARVFGGEGAGLATLWIKERLISIRRPFPTVDEN